ncbi:MAG: GLUG motif-containing protein [Acutalibacteraceae bacterium]
MKIKEKPTARKLVAAVLSLLMICSVLPLFAVTVSAAITPKEPDKIGDVYQIGTKEELYWFADKVSNDNANYGSASAVLTADIVVNTDVLNDSGELNTGTFTSWTPIGNDSNKYTGTFDGQGHTVSGLYFNGTSTDYVGLFGYLGSGGEIKNTGVIDSYFNGANSVGGVCGNKASGKITNCYNTGTVSGSGYVGGVCGSNSSSGTITDCYNTGTVSGSGYVGGVCGYNSAATITNCYNIGTVSATGDNAGGVCGDNYKGTIADCYNTGTVSGSSHVGGVCGFNYYYNSAITGCYNTGTVSGKSYVGGVCGLNNDSTKITGCYNTGTVSATGDYVGGVCGVNYNSGKITGCYNTGTVSATGDYVGGVCGNNSSNGTITGCYINSGDVCGTNSGTVTDFEKYTGNEFKDGTVCKLLNTALKNANSSVSFCQRIDTDASPLLTYQFESIDEHTYYKEYTAYTSYFKKTCLCGKKSKIMQLSLKTEKSIVVNGAENTLTASLSNLEGQDVTYKWYQNDVEIPGANTDTYQMPTNLALGTYTYRVDITMADVGTITRSINVPVDIAPQYYVDIPATVNIGQSFKVEASGILLKNNAQLNIGIESDFTLTNERGTSLNYEILKGSGKLTTGDTLLTVAGSEDTQNPGSGTSESCNVALAKGEKAKYSGNYTDTLTFTIKIEQ